MSKKNITILVLSLFLVVSVLIIISKSASKKIDTKNISQNIENVEITDESYEKDTKNETKETSELITPSFDIVRVENNRAVFAGRAQKNVMLHIMSGDKEIGKIKTDETGEFVYIPKTEFKAGHYEFSLWYQQGDKKIKSSQNAIMMIDEKNASGVAVLIGDNKDTKIIAKPKGDKIGDLQISMVEYDFKGKMYASGYALKNSNVNIYVNNKFVVSTKSDNTGFWSFKVAKTLTQDKSYKIRADYVDANGKVLKRVENRFSTERVIVEKQYTVKKGDCLWKIAKKEYGKGIKYTVIFKANKAQIRNADLIYPNQIFKLPKVK